MKFKIALLLAGIIWGCLFLIKLQYHRRTTLRVLQNHDNSLQYIFETLPQNTQKRPHILFIVADDLGFNDVGYHGSEIKTPNIDKLALSGVRLENYYVQPVCTPTRGQLLSGRYQIHTGLHWVLWPSTRSGLPLDNPTIADKLRAAGYSTHMIGKWHLGFYKPDFLPINRGFDTFFGFLSGHSDYYTHETGNWWGKFMTGYDLMDNDQPANITRYNGSYSTHLFASKAKDIIWGHNYEKPMFIYLSFQAVHAPLQVPENYMKQYANITDIKRRQFAGMVTCMDDAIGSIVDALKKRELWKDTLLIFSTDNGANPNAGGSNWPLKGAKGSYWEGGIRAVGFVYSLLLKMKNGYVSKSLMHVTDWFPTLLNLAKGDLNGTKMLDGYNQWKTIKYGFPSPRQEILHNIDPSCNETYCEGITSMRMGAWKIVARHLGSNDNIQLFNIDNDPKEEINLYARFPNIVQHMLRRLNYYKEGMIQSQISDVDLRADPKFHDGFWQPWEY